MFEFVDVVLYFLIFVEVFLFVDKKEFEFIFGLWVMIYVFFMMRFVCEILWLVVIGEMDVRVGIIKVVFFFVYRLVWNWDVVLCIFY